MGGYHRRFTKFFGNEGNASPFMAAYALQNYEKWRECIENWQRPVLEDIHLPAFYKAALFNELYYIAEGGSVWVDKEINENAQGAQKDDEKSESEGKTQDEQESEKEEVEAENEGASNGDSIDDGNPDTNEESEEEQNEKDEYLDEEDEAEAETEGET